MATLNHRRLRLVMRKTLFCSFFENEDKLGFCESSCSISSCLLAEVWQAILKQNVDRFENNTNRWRKKKREIDVEK